MNTVTTTIYLHETSYGTQVVSNMKLPDTDYILLAESEATFEIPDDFNKVAAQVAQVDKQIDILRGEFGRQLAQLQDQRAKLLCLENGVAA